MAYGGHQSYHGGDECGAGGSGWATGSGQLEEEQEEEEYHVDEELRQEIALWHQQRAQIVSEQWRLRASDAAYTMASAPRDFLGLPVYPVEIVDHFMDDLNEVYVPNRFEGHADGPLDDQLQYGGHHHLTAAPLPRQPAAPATRQSHPRSSRPLRVLTPFEENSVEDSQPTHIMLEEASLPTETDLVVHPVTQPLSEQTETHCAGPEEAEGALLAGEGR